MQLLLLLSLNLLFVLLTGKDPADVIRAMESGLTRCMAALTRYSNENNTAACALLSTSLHYLAHRLFR
eukprot:m.115859 g.115859  ORF g.115859 m.115859 type:complete len:68 (+) comp15380_c0_seq10:682-885(+)